MVSGRLIEIRAFHYRKQTVARLWVIGDLVSGDETALMAEPAPFMPRIGEAVWWQGRTIWFGVEALALRKIGPSFDPRLVLSGGPRP